MSGKLERVLLVGGCGFVGAKLGKDLNFFGFEVMLVDVVDMPTELLALGSVRYKRCSMLARGELEAVFESFQPDAVVMLASVGMSGAGMLDPYTQEANVTGVENVLACCTELPGVSVKALIYTSSYNVVFGGQYIEGGSEALEYYPASGHTDYYSASKRMAEERVLGFDNTATAGGAGTSEVLRTLCLRPAAIYGEGEQRHFPRIVRHVDAGLFSFTIGDKPVVDWVHVNNLSQAFCRGLEALLNDDKVHTVGGKAYFVSDDSPIDSFDFLKPLCAARLAPFPSTVLSLDTALWLAYLMERLHLFLRLFMGHAAPAPFLTRAEVYKVGQTHFMSMDRIKQDLGYAPTLDTSEGAQRMALYFHVLGPEGAPTRFFRVPPYYWWEIIFLSMAVLWAIAFLPEYEPGSGSVCNPGLGPLVTGFCIVLEYTGLFIFRTKFVLKVVWYTAW